MKIFKSYSYILFFCIGISITVSMMLYNWDNLTGPVSITVQAQSDGVFCIHIQKEYPFSGSSSQKIELLWKQQEKPQIITNDFFLTPPQTAGIYSKDSILTACEENWLTIHNTYKTKFSFFSIKKTSEDYIFIQRNSPSFDSIEVKIYDSPERKTISFPMSVIRIICLWSTQAVMYSAIIWIAAKLIYEFTHKR